MLASKQRCARSSDYVKTPICLLDTEDPLQSSRFSFSFFFLIERSEDSILQIKIIRMENFVGTKKGINFWKFRKLFSEGMVDIGGSRVHRGVV